MQKKGDLTVREAGRKGGDETSRTHGHEFYEEIGRKGGEAGGHKGGEATKEKYGHEFYEEIGHKGGQKVKKLIEEGKESER
ncbi:MAG: KGG domain-containing protein [Patescibacteria group bacterium]